MKLIILLLIFPLTGFSNDEKKLHQVYEGGGETKFIRITKNEKAIRDLQKQVAQLRKEIEMLKSDKKEN